MSKTKVTYKLNNLQAKIKRAVNQLKQEKFADTIKDTIVGAVREQALNPNYNRQVIG